MRFNHLDILEQCFHEKFRGYSKQEVDTFLQLVAQDFKEMTEEIEALRSQIKRQTELVEKLEQERQNGSSAAGGLTPEIIKDKARQIVNIAREQAEQQMKKAEKELFRLQEDIRKLRDEKADLLENLKATAKSYFESLQKKRDTANADKTPVDQKL
jgi:cell division initiation protein